MLTLNSFGQTPGIQLPENPPINNIPNAWKGYNEGAGSNVFEIGTPEFENAFSKLDAGIIRWPGGNSGNNYRWQDHLDDDAKLNLKNLAAFLNTFDVDVQVVVNFGNGSAEEAAEFVHVCNNPNAHYTNLRDSLLDHPDPIQVKYWEIGNESTDAWSYGWSWLGYQEELHFQSGVPTKSTSRMQADSLYFYGGALFREGWVQLIGGLNMNTAILGDLKFYTGSTGSDTIKVEYPSLDIADPGAVRVYRTPGFDNVWALTVTSQQELYDSIAKPANLLSPGEFSWTSSAVNLAPNGGLSPNDLVLIEYNSVGHDGAFAFRDAMKAADPAIEVGYTVHPDDNQTSDPAFQQDFANSPPNFMIRHPYASGITIPSTEQGLFSEAAYFSEKKVTALTAFQRLWNQRVLDWQIPIDIGLSLSEWNIALFDDAPDDHPIRGITSGLYIADFWARSFQYALKDSFDLRTLNHFALAAQGHNFIHLMHTNPMFSLSTEGMATTMVMEALGKGLFDVSVFNNPQVEVLTNNNQEPDTVAVDAIQAWAGIGTDEAYINLLLINRDDAQEHTMEIQIPAIWHADSIVLQVLYGTMVDDQVFYHSESAAVSGNTYSMQLPAFSVNTVRIHLSNILNTTGHNTCCINGSVYPNPASTFVYLKQQNEPTSIEIFNSSGQNVTGQTIITSNSIDIDRLPSGVYYILANHPDGKKYSFRFIKE